MKVLSISGGGSEIPALAGAATTILKNGYQPDIIIGTSSGGLCTMMLALGMYEELEHLTKTATLNKVFSIKPINEKGRLTAHAFTRLIGFRKSLGSMGALRKLYSQYITYDIFTNYNSEVLSEKAPRVGVGVTQVETGKHRIFYTHDLHYEEWIDAVIASASIPMIAPPVEILRKHYYDGGVYCHIPTIQYVLKGYIFNSENRPEILEVYSRSNKDHSGESHRIKSWLSVARWYLNASLWSNSVLSSKLTKNYCDAHGIKLEQIFVPKTMKDTLNFNSKDLTKAYETGVLTAQKHINKQ